MRVIAGGWRPGRNRIEVFVLALMAVFAAVIVDAVAAASPELCQSCHAGIEDAHPAVNGRPLLCTTCHGGAGSAVDLGAAHAGMIRNPGDLTVAEERCGSCHGDIVARVRRSIMTSEAGVISGTLYMNGGQADRTSRFTASSFPLMASHEQQVFTDGALVRLDPIPGQREVDAALASGEGRPELVEAFGPKGCFKPKTVWLELLRKECLKCHTNGKAPDQLGDHRGAGCTSCHMIYNDRGLSESDDPTIPKDKPSHPMKHALTAKIPDRQCETCHNRGSRVSTNYRGLMEVTTHKYSLNLLHGLDYKPMPADAHHEKGMACIDCHTEAEVHGDGNLCGKRSEQIEVRCESCHGTPSQMATMETARGRRLSNLRRDGDRVILTGKLDGREHSIVQLAILKRENRLPAAMAIGGHIEKLECYACHTAWVPQCFGCHVNADYSQVSQDWITGEPTRIKFAISGGFKSTSQYLLGVNSRGKICPMTPGGQVFLSETHRDGEPNSYYEVPVTAAGKSGISHNPIVPHTVSRKAVDCVTCHATPSTWGEGIDDRTPLRSWIPRPFGLERFVDKDLQPVGDVVQNGVRPLDAGEIGRMKGAELPAAKGIRAAKEIAAEEVSALPGGSR